MIKSLSVLIFAFEVLHYKPRLFPVKQTFPVPWVSGKEHDSFINQTKALFQIGYMTEHPNSGPVDQGKIATLAFGLAKQAVQPEW